MDTVRMRVVMIPRGHHLQLTFGFAMTSLHRAGITKMMTIHPHKVNY